MTRVCSLVAKVFAVCLMALAACPFTAPFSTCDFDNLVGHVDAAHWCLHDGAPVKVKRSHEPSTAGSTHSGLRSLFVNVAGPSALRAPGAAAPIPTSQLVLRV
jgi:hypothetical protein